MKRIEEFKRGGGAILFVSHDMVAVRRAADRALWMKHGKIIREGATEDVVSAYESGETAN
jgi:ABC-type polysaccharide/polyol phosphate transport system ATPase subunit